MDELCCIKSIDGTIVILVNFQKEKIHIMRNKNQSEDVFMIINN